MKNKIHVTRVSSVYSTYWMQVIKKIKLLIKFKLQAGFGRSDACSGIPLQRFLHPSKQQFKYWLYREKKGFPICLEWNVMKESHWLNAVLYHLKCIRLKNTFLLLINFPAKVGRRVMKLLFVTALKGSSFSSSYSSSSFLLVFDSSFPLLVLFPFVSAVLLFFLLFLNFYFIFWIFIVFFFCFWIFIFSFVFFIVFCGFLLFFLLFFNFFFLLVGFYCSFFLHFYWSSFLAFVFSFEGERFCFQCHSKTSFICDFMRRKSYEIEVKRRRDASN